MKFFVDTADIAEIRDLAATGLLDGVTTNPSLIHKSGRKFLEVIEEICGVVEGPVSAEVVALDHETMMKEAAVLRKIAPNVCIKVPLTIDGLKTCKALTDDGVLVNVTLCFSANQALLAAKAGASFISPFVGRHDDNGFDGMTLIEDIRLIYDNYAFDTEILVASVRHPIHVLESARIGADVMTAPPAVIKALFVAQSQAEADKSAALKDTVGKYYKTSMEAAVDASSKQPIVVDQRSQTQFIIDRGNSMKELGYVKKLPDQGAFDWSLMEAVIAENKALYDGLKLKSA